jgi:tetratricopeptide (TPR) repeat protein
LFRLSDHAGLLPALILAGTIGLAFQAGAHPDLDEQIGQLTAQISDHQHSADLYLQRADLYRRHAQFDEALRDLAVAAKCEAPVKRITLARAKVFSDAGRSEEALEAAQQLLAGETNHWEALIVRARAFQKLNQPQDAIQDYTLAIAKAPAPGPDLFLERASLHVALTNLDAAIRGLDEGIARVGALPALELRAIEIERQRKTFVAAIERVDRIVARYPVKEPSLTLRGEILEQAGRIEEAHPTFQKVLDGIETYPDFRRTLDMTKQLETRARAGKTRTQSKILPLIRSQQNSIPF